MINLDHDSYCNDELPTYVTVGAYSSIAPNVKFMPWAWEHQWTVNHKCVFTINYNQPREGRNTIVGNDVWIGYGATIAPGIKIGDGAIIGMCSVVTKDVPPYAVVCGNPAIIKHFRFSEEQIEKLKKMKWWTWYTGKPPEEVIRDMEDIDLFIEKYGDHKKE